MSDHDSDTLHEPVHGLSRDGNVTDIIKPRKSILKRENTTLPLPNMADRRVSFAEKVKLHKIDFVPVDVTEKEHSPEPLSSDDEDPSFLNLEADADKVLTALGSSLLEKLLNALPADLFPEIYKDVSDDEKTMELTEQIKLTEQMFTDLPEVPQNADETVADTVPDTLPDTLPESLPNALPENKANQSPQSPQSPQAPQSPQSPQAPQSPQSPQAPQSPPIRSDQIHSEDKSPVFLSLMEKEEDMEFTGQITNFKNTRQIAGIFTEGKEDTMELTEYYSKAPEYSQEETMEFTQHEKPTPHDSEKPRSSDLEKPQSPDLGKPQSPDFKKPQSPDSQNPQNPNSEIPDELDEFLSAELDNVQDDKDLDDVVQNDQNHSEADQNKVAHAAPNEEVTEEQIQDARSQEEVPMELTQPLQPDPTPETPPNEPQIFQLQSPVREVFPTNLESIPEQTDEDESGHSRRDSGKRDSLESLGQETERLEEGLQVSPGLEEGLQVSSGLEEGLRVSPKRGLEEGLQVSPKRHSLYVTEVNTTTIPLADEALYESDDYPTLSLEDFLQEIGIKFYDDLEIPTELSSQYRVPSENDEFESADYYRANIQIPLLEVYELSCKELSGKIQQGKLLFKELQQKTLQDNPDLFRLYLKASFYEKVAMRSQFHMMRELTRQEAKHVWYEWRTKLFRNIIEVFQTNINILRDDKRILVANMGIVDENSKETKKKLQGLRNDISRFKAMKDGFRALDAEQISSIKTRMTDLNTKLSGHRDLMLAKERAISAVNAKIAEINDNIAAVQKETEIAQAELNNTRHFDRSEIEGLQTEAKLLEACAGLKYVNSPSTSIYELEFNSKMSITIDLSKHNSTDGLLFHPKSSATPVLYNEILMDYCQHLAESTLFSNIYDTLRTFKEKWARLVSLDEDLYKLSLKYPTKIDTSDLKLINFEVDVYVFQKNLKVTLSGSVSVDDILAYPKSVGMSAKVHRHGKLTQAEVKKMLCECQILTVFPIQSTHFKLS